MDKNRGGKGLLLTNLGTPASLHLKDIRQFLTRFLMDKNVMDYPYLFRLLLVRGIIVPSRASKSLEAYRKVWMEEGSPLMVYSRLLQKKVQAKTGIPVALSMRYGRPSTEDAFQELLHRDPALEEVIVLPLYPHYTMSSLGTALEEINYVHTKGRYPFTLQFLKAFYNDPAYISSLAESIRPYLYGDYDKLLFSYHGIPDRHLGKDGKSAARLAGTGYQAPDVNYQIQALETSRLVAATLQIPPAKYEVSFQSRLTAAGVNWLRPYTANRLANLPAEGAKKILVVCPAFVSDCLETLEEIGIQGEETFLQSGGTNLTLIPCINDRDQFAMAIANWVSV